MFFLIQGGYQDLEIIYDQKLLNNHLVENKFPGKIKRNNDFQQRGEKYRKWPNCSHLMSVPLPLADHVLLLHLALHGVGEGPHGRLHSSLSLFLLLEKTSKVVRKLCSFREKSIHFGVILKSYKKLLQIYPLLAHAVGIAIGRRSGG